MLTFSEILRGFLTPLLVSALITLAARWWRASWLLPLAVGTGFLAGFTLLGIPRLPPRDGTDWLFWATIPATLLGVVDALAGRKWGWILGGFAGPATCLLLRPLVPSSLSESAFWIVSAGFGIVGAFLCLVAEKAERFDGFVPVVIGIGITLAGAGVVVLSSNLRIGGVYGLAAAMATLPVAFFGNRAKVARSILIVAGPILIGVLVGGHYYPDPGVGWPHLALVLATPVLLMAGSVLPTKNKWVRGVVAVALVAIAIAAIAMPVALAAKRAAEADPYGGM